MSGDRQFPDLLNQSKWVLLSKGSYQKPQNLDRIPAPTFLVVDSHVLVIGVATANSLPTWFTGGWATQFLSFVPGVGSDFPVAIVASRQRLRLGSLNLLIFPDLSSQWTLEVTFPEWFVTASLEIWRYDGADTSSLDQLALAAEQLDRIESRLDNP
jgi:hypothetical protein